MFVCLPSPDRLQSDLGQLRMCWGGGEGWGLVLQPRLHCNLSHLVKLFALSCASPVRSRQLWAEILPNMGFPNMVAQTVKNLSTMQETWV